MKTKVYITKGFSIIELIIVLLVSSIISMVVIPNYEKVQTYAKETTSKNQLFNLQLALETFFLENGVYPNTINTQELITILESKNILKSTLKNPFTNNVFSENDTSGKVIYSSTPPNSSYILEVFGTNNQHSLLRLTH